MTISEWLRHDREMFSLQTGRRLKRIAVIRVGSGYVGRSIFAAPEIYS
jgi:hypothetical protein